MLDCVEVRIHESAEEFRAIAEPLYRRDPVTNTIELTLLRANRFGDDALLLSVWEDGTAVGAALQTPPYPLACNGIPIEVHAVVATELARTRPGLTGVRGKRDMALAFADAWHAATGLAGTVTTEERLYRLGMLQPPAGVCGAHRGAADADQALLVDWVEQFFVETFSHQRDDTAGRRFIDNANAVGDRFVLWNDDGSAGEHGDAAGTMRQASRVSVRSSRRRSSRGRGYGSAVTAAAAQLARDAGVDDVVLFADLANPTSNAIYQRIGFERRR